VTFTKLRHCIAFDSFESNVCEIQCKDACKQNFLKCTHGLGTQAEFFGDWNGKKDGMAVSMPYNLPPV
jgi:hypothetical protein